MKDSTRVKLAGYGALAMAGLACESGQAAIITSTNQGFTPFTIGVGEFGFVDFGSFGGLGPPLFAFFGNSISPGPPYSTLYPGAGQFLVQAGPTASASILGTSSFTPSFTTLFYPVRNPANYVVSAGCGCFWLPVGNAYPPHIIAGAASAYWNDSDSSNPPGPREGFMAFRFVSPGGDPGDFQYGFFEIAYSNTPSFANGELTVRGWAYETEINAPITTFSVVPEPSSVALFGLGLLACGGAGLRTLRAQRAQRRAEVAESSVA